MRIALVIERFEPAGGGMEAVAWQVAHGLAEAGDEVCVVARTGRDSPAVQLLRVPVAGSWQPLRVTSFSRAAARAAPRGAWDVVHAFSRTRHQDLYRAGGGSHADYLERSHSGLAQAARRLTPRHRVLLGIERRVFADDSQAIQCGSKLVRDQIAKRFGVPDSRLHVLYNGVDCQRFHPASRRDPGGPGPVWLFAASGWRRKGLDVALAALAAARGDASRAVLRVAGRDAPGPWRREAARLGVIDRVEFLGPHRDVAALYREADGLLLPTRYDAFANVALEAAASGIPVVTSAANGSAELLGGAGIVVEDAEDVAGFARALERLADCATRRRLGEAGRRIAEQHGWDRHIASLRDLYRSLCR
jgi:UDP-glucose:(heptosyl)LPS alpha-1,3-glucosyltransferase